MDSVEGVQEALVEEEAAAPDAVGGDVGGMAQALEAREASGGGAAFMDDMEVEVEAGAAGEPME